jgi:beta-lactam-binding protein with PASTA domain/predicted Ser/Thr protein kinase
MTQARLVGGRYELGELIGYGGMAEVHRGRDVRLGREVAIKVLRADLARDPSFLNRFRREAQAAAGLNHPSIVSVYDTGEDVGIDGAIVPYIVMEYVEGRTLRDILKAEGRLPARRAMEIAADVCGALDFSHRNGIVHRDIKPANVMITQSGAVKVMDFGIARAVADNAATVTQTANVIGTAQYLSPEQARGEAVDARSDVYSTGCLLYELVTGSPPFQGDSPVAVAYQHVRENAMAPSSRNAEVPAAVDSIVMKALAKNQLNRYQTAGEMRTDLQRALANQPVAAEAVMSDAERTQFIARSAPPVALRREEELPPDADGERRSGLLWAAIVIVLLLVIGAAVAAVFIIGGKDKAAAKVAVPSIIGQLPAAGEDALRSSSLQPTKGDDTNGTCFGGQTVEKGRICTVDPPPGTQVVKNTGVTYHLYTPKTVSVPSEINKTYSDAANDLNRVGLVPKQKLVDNPAAAGTVIAQSPDAFTAVAPGSGVTLQVSTGKVKLPDVRGQTLANALQTLNNAQYTNVDSSQVVETATKAKDGTVAAESPLPGISYPLDTQVRLTIYKYVKPTPTPTATPTTTASNSGSPSSSASTSASSSGLPGLP